MTLLGIHRVWLRWGNGLRLWNWDRNVWIMVLLGVCIWLRWVDGLGLRNWDRNVWIMVLLGVSIWLRRVDWLRLGVGNWDRHIWIMVFVDWLRLVLDLVCKLWLYNRLRLVEVGVLLL